MSLTEYINEQLKMIPSFYKKFGIIVDEIDPYDYDKFLVNNGLLACDESYKKFIDFTDIILNTLPFDIQYTYQDRQKYIYNIKERLGDSLYYTELIKKLQNEFDFNNVVDIVNSKSKHAKSFIIKTNNTDIKDNPQFISLLAYYNYFINSIGPDYMQLSPYKPTEATNIVYKDFNGILYHICTKDQLQKIKKYGLLARNVTTENTKRPYRRFYIASAKKEKIKSELKLLCNSLVNGYNRRNYNKKYRVSKDDIIVLTVDVNKSSRQYKFYYDDSAAGYHAYFTEETIPPYCIVSVSEYNEI